jgi:hypothetical protein
MRREVGIDKEVDLHAFWPTTAVKKELSGCPHVQVACVPRGGVYFKIYFSTQK